MFFQYARTDSAILHATMLPAGIKQKKTAICEWLTKRNENESKQFHWAVRDVSEAYSPIMFFIFLFFPLADKALICRMNGVYEMMAAC